MIPGTNAELDMQGAEQVQKFIDKLEDDDVQDVYHNAEFPDEWGG